ncbi:MAG: hypothetical protein LBV04_06260 [Deferribacteraceae bacterium]|nr:hypothetical protein [Deferribacteraceae bacterium]
MKKLKHPIILSLLIALVSAIISIYIICEGYALFISVLTLASVIFTSIMAFFNWRGLQMADAKMQEAKAERRRNGLIDILENRCNTLGKLEKLQQNFQGEISTLVKELFLLDEVLEQAHRNDLNEIVQTRNKDVIIERLKIILKGAKQ